MKMEHNLTDRQTDRQTRQRNTNLELFRIFSMLFIVAHHYVVNSGMMEQMSANPFAINSLFFYVFGAWGKIGINCFMMITGYFMCKSKITFKKFLKLLLEVMFYRWIIYAIFLFSGYEPFSLKTLRTPRRLFGTLRRVFCRRTLTSDTASMERNARSSRRRRRIGRKRSSECSERRGFRRRSLGAVGATPRNTSAILTFSLPTLTSTSTKRRSSSRNGAGLSKFCSCKTLGASRPDITASTRRISRAVCRRCVKRSKNSAPKGFALGSISLRRRSIRTTRI